MSDNKNIDKLVKRFQWIYILALVLGVIAIAKIIKVQYFVDNIVVKEDFYRLQKIDPKRGSILSCDGRPLATSMPFYQIRLDCTACKSDSLFNAEVGALAEKLSSFFQDKSPSAYRESIINGRKSGNKYMLVGNRELDYIEMEEARKFPLFRLGQFKGGLIVEQKNKRTNPYGKLAYRTVGYINAEGNGVGIEGSLDYKLKGEAGQRTMIRQLGGEWIPVNGEKIIPAKDGYDIQTTLDIDIQEAAEVALREQLAKSDVLEGATAIVMEVKTGAVRAIANMKKMKDGTFDESYNYAIRERTEPGSTMKLATLISLIEDEKITLESTIDAGVAPWIYGTTTFREAHHGGYGVITVKQALEKSSNVAFAKLVVENYGDKPAEFISRLHNLKIGERFNLDIEGEVPGTITSTTDALWSKPTLPFLGIGYAMLVTPLHTLVLYNAVANNGKMMKPYFVDNYQESGRIVEQFSPQEISGSICSKRTIGKVREALRGVVEHGTAKSLDDSRYHIAGKTGTAQMAFSTGGYTDSQGNRRHQASFAGFFPFENPQFSCIVVLYSGRTKANFYGGSWAAPVFKQIADKIYTSHPEWSAPISGKDILPPDNPNIAGGKAKDLVLSVGKLPMKNKPAIKESGWVEISTNETGELIAAKVEIEKNRVPDVTNMGLKDALYILENEGYRVSFTGNGKIVSQNPLPGTELEKRGVIELELK